MGLPNITWAGETPVSLSGGIQVGEEGSQELVCVQVATGGDIFSQHPLSTFNLEFSPLVTMGEVG